MLNKEVIYLGKFNTALKNMFSIKPIFADLVNGIYFKGRQVVSPSELELIDTSTGLIIKDSNAKKINVERIRDLAMCWKGQADIVLYFVEFQDKVHYGMPVRNMMYDSLSYLEQMRELWYEVLKEDPSKRIGTADMFSRFRKGDKLRPVITLVFFCGDCWDGPTSIFEMLDIGDETTEFLKEYIPNYHINIVNPNDIEDLRVFKKDLQMIFGMVQSKQCKTDMRNLVTDNIEYFENVGIEIVYGIEAMVGSDFLSKSHSNRTETGGVNVCKAFNDMVEEGREEERVVGIRKLVATLRELDAEESVIINALVKQYELTDSEVKKYL